MLSANSSRISINCPERTLSTSLRGKGSAAGERTRPKLGVSARKGPCSDVVGVMIDAVLHHEHERDLIARRSLR